MIKRIICDIALFATVFLGPWWLVTIFSLVFMFAFKNYREAVIVAIFMDALYYIPSGVTWGNFGIFTLSSILIVVVAEKIKKQIRI